MQKVEFILAFLKTEQDLKPCSVFLQFSAKAEFILKFKPDFIFAC